MTKKLALIGGGGHALSLLDILPASAKVSGYVDFNPGPDMSARYLGSDEDFLTSCHKDEYEILVTLVSGPDCTLDLRRRVIGKYQGYDSPVVIAGSAIVSPTARFGHGTAVFHRSVVNAAVTTGSHCIVNTGAIIEHGCHIGDNVFIGPGAILCGGATILDNTYIGAGAIVKPCMTVCAGAIIGAGAVVVNDITEPFTYIGVPAKPVKR